jgi:endonuclease/exonuclease/phosphatase family metal-dependent hydrolase
MALPVRTWPWGAAAAVLATMVASEAHSQVRVMTWNVARMQGNADAIGSVLWHAHRDDRPGWASPVDILVFQEVTPGALEALAPLVAASAPAGTTYELASYTTSNGENSSGGAAAMFYRTQSFVENAAAHIDLPTGAGRNTDRWLMQMVGYSSPAARTYVYGTHLKASTGETNVQLRLEGALTIRGNADALGAGVRAIYVGDFNVYSNTEDAFLAMLAAGNGRAIDPFGGGSWDDGKNSIVHTQSPRESASGGLVGGGLDDRFDLLLTTVQLADGSGLAIIPGTCRTLGNDGNHYQQSINSGVNTYYPGQPARSSQLANALFAASDHLPVIADLQVPARIDASLDAVPPRVIVAAPVTVSARIANAASVVTPLGADELSYAITSLQHCTASGSGTAPLLPSSASVPVTLATATPGLRTARIGVSSASEAVEPPSLELSAPFTVLAPSRPSLMAGADIRIAEVHVPLDAGDAPIDIDVLVWNHNFQALQSALDIDSTIVGASAASAAVTVLQGTDSEIGTDPATLRFRISPKGLRAGEYSVPVTVRTSDENVPGERVAELLITIVISLTAPEQPADLNGDGAVDGFDLAILLTQWAGPGSADLDLSGIVDGIDLAFLLARWTL